MTMMTLEEILHGVPFICCDRSDYADWELVKTTLLDLEWLRRPNIGQKTKCKHNQKPLFFHSSDWILKFWLFSDFLLQPRQPWRELVLCCVLTVQAQLSEGSTNHEHSAAVETWHQWHLTEPWRLVKYKPLQECPQCFTELQQGDAATVELLLFAYRKIDGCICGCVCGNDSAASSFTG